MISVIKWLTGLRVFVFPGDIGGTLALYIGISAFTLFEIIDFLCGTMFCKGNQKRMDVNLWGDCEDSVHGQTDMEMERAHFRRKSKLNFSE